MNKKNPEQISSDSFLTIRALTTFKLEGEVTSLSESSQGEVGDNREKWGDFWVTYRKSLECKTPIVKVDRNKNVT
jgi:hypothetical protein